ncbi:hypothetical protein, partial [Skermanella aerolata]
MRRLDPAPFLASDNIDDNVLAILCRDGTNPAIIQEVERRIEAMDETGKSQAYLKIILCGAVRKVEILAMLKNAEIDLSKYEDYPFVQTLRWIPLVRQLGWRVKRESRGIIAPCR